MRLTRSISKGRNRGGRRDRRHELLPRASTLRRTRLPPTSKKGLALGPRSARTIRSRPRLSSWPTMSGITRPRPTTGYDLEALPRSRSGRPAARRPARQRCDERAHGDRDLDEHGRRRRRDVRHHRNTRHGSGATSPGARRRSKATKDVEIGMPTTGLLVEPALNEGIGASLGYGSGKQRFRCHNRHSDLGRRIRATYTTRFIVALGPGRSDGATGTAAAPQLSTRTDPEGRPLSGSFFGRAYASGMFTRSPPCPRPRRARRPPRRGPRLDEGHATSGTPPSSTAQRRRPARPGRSPRPRARPRPRRRRRHRLVPSSGDDATAAT